MTKYFVYMLRCADGTLYTGISTDISRRLDEHNRGVASKYTRVRLPVALVFQEEAMTRSDALKREAAIKNLSRTEKLRLIATLVLMLLLLGACTMPNTRGTSYLATKAPYPAPAEGHTYEAPPKDCEPIHIEGLFRHGSRYLAKAKSIEKLARVMRRAKTKGNLSESGVEILDAVEQTLADFKPGQLTKQGQDEQFALGARMGQQFEALFRNNKAVELTAAPKERIKESREHFKSGLASRVRVEAILHEGDVRILRYFEYCPSYVDYKSSIKELYKRSRGTNISAKNGVKTLFNKLGKKDTRKVTEGLYALCQLDYNLWQGEAEQRFCSLLSGEEKKVQQEQHNIKTYHRIGPVADNGMACPVIEPMFTRMQDAVRGKKVAAADLAFAHAESVVPVGGFFELFAHNLHKWDASKAGPMAANFQLVTYSCGSEEKPSFKVKLLYNERERHFNIPECQKSYYCDWDLVKSYYERRKRDLGMKTCSQADWEEHCKVQAERQ